jgi:glyoxylate reductase
MASPLPKVVFTAPVSEMPNDLLDGRVRVKVLRHKLPLTEEQLIAKLKNASGALCFLSDPLTGRVLESCPKLKGVALHAVGYNNVDIAAASRLGITVTYTPGVLTEATADLTWALILGACRRVVEGDKMVRAGRFKGWDAGLLLGMDLRDKTLGIVGLGRIGQAVARRAIPFGLRVAYAQRKHADAAVEAALGARYLPLDDLIRESDILSLHCPLTIETDHLLSRERLFAMKPGAVLINASRGPLVDESALAEALETGHLFAAGLDVFEREPEVHPALRRIPNVVLMPHAGSAGRETRAAMARMAVSDLLAVLEGRAPKHPVPRAEG